jgi:hypothetical protein
VSAAKVTSSGVMTSLDGRAPTDIVITSKDVEDVERLARLVQEQARKLAVLERRWSPRRIDFEGYAVTSGDTLRLEHGFGGRVRWWIVEWTPTTPGDVALFEQDSSTAADVLALDVGNSGTVSIRVEAAG